MKVRLKIAYHGAAFHGWQIQSVVRTVEGEITKAVEKLTGTSTKVQGASRTDAGVHAEGQVAHFEDDGKRTCGEYFRALNRLTPRDMAVVEVTRVAADFHARHDARGKIYRYRVTDGFYVPPMLRDRAWHVPRTLNLDAMQLAASRLVGTHDFSSFQGRGCEANGTVRTLRRVDVSRSASGEVLIHVEGDAFLKYMVRNIVGTLVSVGRGSEAPAWIEHVIDSRDRRVAGVTAPSHGLTLVDVLYPLR